MFTSSSSSGGRSLSLIKRMNDFETFENKRWLSTQINKNARRPRPLLPLPHSLPLQTRENDTSATQHRFIVPTNVRRASKQTRTLDILLIHTQTQKTNMNMLRRRCRRRFGEMDARLTPSDSEELESESLSSELTLCCRHTPTTGTSVEQNRKQNKTRNLSIAVAR